MATVPQSRLPNESAAAYRAYCDYRAMGGGGRRRSLRDLLDEYVKREKPPTIRWSTLTSWSMRHEWVERAKAYDADKSTARVQTAEQFDMNLIAHEYEVLGTVNREILQRLGDDPTQFTSRQLISLSREITHRLEMRLREAQRTSGLLLLRFQVLERDGFTCRYCGRSPLRGGIELQIDHLFPESRGGELTLENLVTSCVDCNLGKSDVILEARRLADIGMRVSLPLNE